MSLIPSGIYTIVTKENQPIGVDLADGNQVIGRPIPVVSLPHGVERPRWEIINKGETHVLTIRGGTAADIDNRVATLPQPDVAEWRIVPHPLGGENTYNIFVSDGSTRGWELPNEEPFTQIEVKPLIRGPAIPNQLFVINPVPL